MLSSGGDTAAESAATAPAAPDTTLASAEPEAAESAPAAAAAEAPADDTAVSSDEPVEEERTEPLLDEEGNPIEVLHPEERPVLEVENLNAGPIQFVPTLCEVNGIDLVSFDGIEDFVAAGDRFFFSSDDNVVALSQDEGSGPGGPCSLSVDESMGPGGVLLAEDGYDTLSSNAEGRVVVSGIWGSYVFDTHLNQSFQCDDMSGNVTLSSDGTTGLSTWVKPEVEVWSIADSFCTQGETVQYPDFEQVNGVTVVGSDVYIDGRFDGNSSVTRYVDGVPQWTLGDGEPSDPDWWASSESIVPCGEEICLTEFFGTFNVIDPSGVVVANFDGSDVTSGRGFSDMATGTDGAIYVIAGDLFDHEFDGRTWFNWIIRLDRVG